jgi:hypothetical protein
MLNHLKAPLVLIALAISLAGCIIVPDHHHDHYYGGGGGYYSH